MGSPAAADGAPPAPPARHPESRVKPAPPIPIPPDAAPSPPEVAPDGAGAVSEADFAFLRARKLLIPVAGIVAKQLRDSFHDPRSEGRAHQAIDIMAPQGTPVLAVTDGKIMKLHESDRGGMMIYQTDAAAPFVYYYGHLQRYADNLSEGNQVRRGEVIAYVGDTGNAGAGNYHLHFGISKMPAPSRWSGGTPINPFPLLGGM